MPPKRARPAEKEDEVAKKKTKKEKTAVAGETSKKTKQKQPSKAKQQKKAKPTKKTQSKSAKTKSTKPGSSTKKAQAANVSDVACLPTTLPKNSWLFDFLTDNKWKGVLAPYFQTEKFKAMEPWLQKEYKKAEVFPPKNLIFNAFNLTPFDEVKVVILGQDPYHDDGQAEGLSFSVPKGMSFPPSLKNIFKELMNDHKGFKMPNHGCLDSWAKQGVLLINAALTVQAHAANSHARCGWWEFTDNVMKTISNHGNHTVFVLWGGFAHKKESLLDGQKHTIIKTAHPSPLSFNKFKDCKCFSQTNAALVKHGQFPIDWNVK